MVQSAMLPLERERRTNTTAKRAAGRASDISLLHDLKRHKSLDNYTSRTYVTLISKLTTVFTNSIIIPDILIQWFPIFLSLVHTSKVVG